MLHDPVVLSYADPDMCRPGSTISESQTTNPRPVVSLRTSSKGTEQNYFRSFVGARTMTLRR